MNAIVPSVMSFATLSYSQVKFLNMFFNLILVGFSLGSDTVKFGSSNRLVFADVDSIVAA